MDLIKAEAIHDLIFAKTEDQAKLSVKKFDGKTSRLIEELKQKLLYIIATIETNIDYPEYDDVEKMTSQILMPKLKEVQNDLNQIIESSKSSKYIYQGVEVAIVGRPNAGKSSLLNAFLNEEKAIVTDVPGTTRDIVEGQVQINQVLLHFKDTAGIHKTSNKVEKIGIEKSMNQIKNADLVIHLIDPLDQNIQENAEIKKAAKDKIYLKVYNKSDIKAVDGLQISAKNKQIEPLQDAIAQQFKNINLDNEKIIYNTRQLSLIDLSLESIKQAIEGLNNQMNPDEVIVDIRQG